MSKYEVLGVSRSASSQELKRAYQAAALATHPDKQAGSSDTLRSEVCDCCYEITIEKTVYYSELVLTRTVPGTLCHITSKLSLYTSASIFCQIYCPWDTLPYITSKLSLYTSASIFC